MSDLDADLYGDLYGADDNDFASATEPAQDVKTEEQEQPDEPAPTPAKLAEPVAVKSAPAPAPVKVPVAAVPAPAKIETFEPTTQQIPTYQETPDYTDYSGALDGGDEYANANRPIRPSEMKEEGKMFIGGLNWDTTDEGLRNYFSQFGKVEACTIMRDAGGRSRCFAFLTFEDPASVNAVMVREHYLDGKIIDPKRAIPRQEHQRATKLFIGGLAGTVTSESMREYFSQFGRVVDSTVMLDRETGRSKGFGFVSLENVDVDPILGFGKLEIDGKLIDVKLAQPRSAREGQEGAVAAPPATTPQFTGQNNFNNNNMGNQSSGANTPFDPNALATLWTRMFQQMGGGGMNPAMMGNGAMNPMMAAQMGGAGGMGGAMNPMMAAQMGAMGRGAGGMPGMPGMGAMGAMGRGASGGMPNPGMMGGMNQNIPRGPRGAGQPGPAGVGPQRTGQRNQHGYHPYSR